jgi:hypothetical protein
MPEQGTCERCGYISSQVSVAFAFKQDKHGVQIGLVSGMSLVEQLI